MSRIALVLFSLAALASALPGKPQITQKTGVQTLAGVADRNALARGSVFAVTGTELAASVDVIAGEVPYPQVLEGVSVNFSSADGAVTGQAYLISISAGRLLAIVPSFLPAGDYSVTVTLNEESSDPYAVKVVDSNFGLITDYGGPGGLAQGRILAADADPVAVSFLAPVTPLASLEFDATGSGAVDGSDNEAPPEANRFEGAVLVVGELEIPITYLGRNPARPGFDKLVVTMPEGELPTGCLVEFAVKAADQILATFSLPVANDATVACEHPFGVSPEGLATLANGGSIIRGGMYVTRNHIYVSMEGFSFTSVNENFSGVFNSVDEAALTWMALNARTASKYEPNGCIVFDAGSGGISTPNVDAGDPLTLTGPGGINLAIPRVDYSAYALQISAGISGITIPGYPGADYAPTVVPGTYNLHGPGGTVVDAFDISMDASTALTWSNPELVKDGVNRSSDLPVLWTGAGDDDMIQVIGNVVGAAPEDASKQVSRSFICQGKGSDGQIVVPADVLVRMPLVEAVSVEEPVRQANFTLSQSSNIDKWLFRAPLVGGGLTEKSAYGFGYSWTYAPVTLK
jgi:uncharacterized protein (TIGR03437 family)